MDLTAQGKIDTAPLITHIYVLKGMEKAYELPENHGDYVLKVALK